MNTLKTVALCLLLIIITGCDDGYVDWSGDQYDLDETGDNSTNVQYPENVTYIVDLYFDSTGETYRALAGTTSEANEWIHVDASTGEILSSTENAEPLINQNSEIVYAGNHLWATAHQDDGGVIESYIDKVDPDTGEVLEEIPCPATATGYCEGLAWDGELFWTGSSDSSDLVGFEPDGTVVDTIENLWDTNSTKLDLAWDSPSEFLIAVKSGHPAVVDIVSGEIITESSRFIGERGGWFGELFWSPDNTNQEFDRYFIEL